MKLLEFNNVNLIYQTDESETHALKDVSFGVEKGEFVAIVGPSGCGKTTILSLTAGLIKPTSGEILVGGSKITKPSGKVGYMLQHDQLFEWRTIFANVTLGLEIRKIKSEENLNYAKELLTKYGLIEFSKNFPSQLSGGMRQRVALIRTLVYRPDVLLLDEPFSALDFQTRLNVHEDVYPIIKNEGKTALLVTHDISEAIALSDKIIVLSSRPGRIKKIVNVNLSGSSPKEKRESHDYPLLFEEIWREVTS